MYIPAYFAETSVSVLYELMRDYPLAMLVTLGAEGLNANHLPLVFDPEPAPYGTLRGHVARANSVWRDFDSSVETLAVFQGANAYITPSWYATKQETGKVVPTWNYAVVHAYGTLKIIEDRDWLRDLVTRLTKQHEAKKPQPWHVSDAPEDYIESLLGAIIGIEITITKLLGKFKASQNQNPVNRAGVINGLRADDDDEAQAMADLIAR